MDPPIQFGPLHSYWTRCKDTFANILPCHLVNTMKHFRFAATAWWNALPSPFVTSYFDFANSVQSLYLDDCCSYSSFLFFVLYFIIIIVFVLPAELTREIELIILRRYIKLGELSLTLSPF